MKKLDTLYKIDTTGKLREWTMVIEDSCFHAIKGVVGGKLIEDKPRCCESKNVGRSNETTPQEQAESEAQSKWQKKLDKDYALTEEDARRKYPRALPLNIKRISKNAREIVSCVPEANLKSASDSE